MVSVAPVLPASAKDPDDDGRRTACRRHVHVHIKIVPLRRGKEQLARNLFACSWRRVRSTTIEKRDRQEAQRSKDAAPHPHRAPSPIVASKRIGWHHCEGIGVGMKGGCKRGSSSVWVGGARTTKNHIHKNGAAASMIDPPSRLREIGAPDERNHHPRPSHHCQSRPWI
jgi:hypothetical protein